MSETRVASIPSVTENNLVEVARAVKNILDVREGRAGDKLDSYVTFRELIAAGLASSSDAGASSAPLTGGITVPIVPVSGGTSAAYDPTTDATVPPAPTGFTVTGLFGAVQLNWLLPSASIANYAYTEIWRADEDAIGSAVKIGTSIGSSYLDYLGSSKTRYYWIRFVSQANVTGPYNSTSGTAGNTAPDPSYLLEVLTNQITESQLFTSLGSRINLIDRPGTGLVTQVSQLNGQYTVKIDNNGYVTGFGLASTAVNGTPFSQFIVRADRFSIGSPSGPSVPAAVPFVVQTTPGVAPNGSPIPVGVYIDGAYIKAATINSAQIGSVYADTISAGYTSSVDLESSTFFGSELYLGGTVTYEYFDPSRPSRKTGIGTVTNPNIALKTTGAEFNVNYFKIRNGISLVTPFEVVNNEVRITNAAIGVGTITSANIADTIQSTNYTTTTGWQINKAGAATFNQVALRGALNGGAFTGYVWPPAGAGNTGFHLGPQGLLLGNFNNGSYFQVDSSGNMYSPSFRIVNGQMTLDALNVVKTLNIDNEQVFVARWANGNVATTFGSTAGVIASLFLPISGLPSGALASVIISAFANYSPTDGNGASVYTNIRVNGATITPDFGVTVGPESVFAGNSALIQLGNGTHTIELTTAVKPPGVSSKFLNAFGVLTAQAGKR